MSQVDWTLISDGLSAAQMARGVSSGFTPPNGGGLFAAGYRSLVATSGFAGFYCNLLNFGPLLNNAVPGAATGGVLQFAVQKRDGGAAGSFCPLGFIGLRSGSALAPAPSVADVGYLFGLEDANPYRIVLVKGTPSAGLPTGAVLVGSTQTYTIGQWHHLRIDMIVNPTGDVILRFFANDLTLHAVTAPTWAQIAGMADYTDDSLGVISGSEPLSGGFIGWGMWSAAMNRVGLFDHAVVRRQT